MTETSTTSSPPQTPLDDVMIAMDIVDTLRHDKRIVERELGDETRRKELIDELREIYRGQGIEVTDEMLEAGVKALEDERFKYKPPPDSLTTRLAKLYVTRDRWGGYVIAALAALFVIFTANYFFNERPKQLAAAQQRVELTETIPKHVAKLAADITSEATDPSLAEAAQRLRTQSQNAASSSDIKAARVASKKLQVMLTTLRQAYTVRIVNQKGELTGLWRVPKTNPNTYNYYLVVEAIDATGKRIQQEIMSEETGKRSRVNKWAVRVPKSVLDSVSADKKDDGILQNAVAGKKTAGNMDVTWTIPAPSGAITKW